MDISAQVLEKQRLNQSKSQVKKLCKQLDRDRSGLIDTDVFVKLLQQNDLPSPSLYRDKQVSYKESLKMI